MFLWRSLLPPYRRLLRDGKRANAVVVQSRPGSGTPMSTRLTLEVHLPGGVTTEVTKRVIDRAMGFTRTTVGAIVPMRYDPDRRSRITIDFPEVQRLAAAEGTQLEDQLRRSGQATLAKEHSHHQHQPRRDDAVVSPIAAAHSDGVLRAAGEDERVPFDDDRVIERLRGIKQRYRAGELDRVGVAAELRTIKEEQFQRELTAFLDSPD